MPAVLLIAIDGILDTTFDVNPVVEVALAVALSIQEIMIVQDRKIANPSVVCSVLSERFASESNESEPKRKASYDSSSK